MTTGDILVLGLGNVLMGDDAFGPTVIEELRAGFDFPECITLLDGGTPGLNLMAEVIGAEVLIVIDTVKAKGLPGEMRLYRKGELSGNRKSSRQSPHEPGLDEVLTALDLAGRAPREALLIGVIAQSVETGDSLSETLRAAVPAAMEAAIAELERCGLEVRPKAVPAAADLWWERAVC